MRKLKRSRNWIWVVVAAWFVHVPVLAWASPQSEQSVKTDRSPETSAATRVEKDEKPPPSLDAIEGADTGSIPADGEQPSGLTLDGFVQMALAGHPRVAELSAQVEALEGKHLQAGLRPNPVIGYSGQQLFSGGAAEQQGLLIGQNIVRRQKLDLDQAVVCREIDEATQRLAIAQQQVLTDVRLGFHAALAAQRRREITNDLLALSEKNLATVARLVKAKEVAKIDQLRAKLEVQRARLQNQNAENDWRAAWSRLAAVVGQPTLEPAPVAGQLDDTGAELEQSTILDRLMTGSPEVARALADRERAAAVLQRAMVEPLPDVNVEAIVQHDNAANGANGVLQISFPVPVRNWNQGGIRQAQGELAAADQVVRRVELGLANRLADAFQRYQNALNQVREGAASGGIIDNARQSLELISTAYSAGEINYLELLTAQRLLAEARLMHIDALAALWSSRIEIDGLLLKGSLAE